MIGEAAERVPELVQGLIYVTALIVPPGKSVRNLFGSAENAHAAPTGEPITLAPEQAIPMFYNGCTAEDAAWATARLCAEPPRPIATPASVTWDRWGRLPRAFIECTEDRTLGMDRQRMLQATAPCDPVISLDTDHSPFLSAPEKLATAMCSIAGTFATRAA